jgi:hypothetical protein
VSARRARWAALALIAALAGCQTAASGAWRAAPQERGQVEAWLAAERGAMAERRSVRAFAKLRVASEQGGGSVRAAILAERPARLRLETLNLLGQTQTLLVVDGERFAFYDGRAIERGVTAPELLRERLGLDVEPQEAVALLLAAPELPQQAPARVWLAGEERRAEFADTSVSFGADGALSGVARLDAAGGARWSAQFSDWRAVPGGRYPGALSFDFPGTGVRAELALSEVELNPELEPSLFRVAGGPGD